MQGGTKRYKQSFPSSGLRSLGSHGFVHESFLERRMKLFADLVRRIPKPITLLDVGGTVEFWRGRIPEECSVTILNMFYQKPMQCVQVYVGDGCDLARFEDRSFDVVFSNSVLAFVGGTDQQHRMAAEIRRVGRRYFVQTPNQRFPLDWRTLVPFFHWLSPSVQAWCFLKIPVGRYEKVRDATLASTLATRVRDLTYSELRRLFPEGTIVSERLLGLTKSFMVHYGF